MIQSLIILAGLICIGESGLVTHHEAGNDHHTPRATSYQSFHMEHFHAVPTYVKKEFRHLLEHPISVGNTKSKVEVHHGDKHDHGYAIADNENSVHETSVNEHSNGDAENLLENAVDQHQYQSYEHNFETAPVQHTEEADEGEGHHHHSQAAEGHYQPTMYVVQYQNEMSDGQHHEH